jgi:single-strand DNA-binding protein
MLFDDINEVRLMGNITQDPDLRFTPSGSAVLNFSMATNRSYKLNEEWKEEVTFHNIVVWANLAQQLSTRIKKGTKVHVEGRLQTRTWESEGKKNYKTEIVANNVILIDRYEKGQGAAPSQGEMERAPKIDPKKDLGFKSASSMMSEEPDMASNTIDPDDLPF